MKRIPKPRLPMKMISNPDARAWARTFIRFVKWKPSIATDEGTMIGWFANAMMAMHDFQYQKMRAEAASMITASEAIFGFAAWLTTREESITMGSKYDSGAVCSLVDRWCKVNNLDYPRDVYPKNIKHPAEVIPSKPPKAVRGWCRWRCRRWR